MIRLSIRFNGAVIQELEFDQDEITIGRNADNSVQIDNVTVSGKHARILRERNQHLEEKYRYIVEDLESTNGTFVNEKKVARRVLREKDLITVGKHTIAVSFRKFGLQERGQSISEIEKTQRLEPDRQKQILRKLFR
ncbi:MAG: FHA domain-containing protein [Candidatus Abyssobacteria bacterium SURF_5]|uniref:FHA domain-containing protein n=1 Tax=Abyssobacteria bacterium (strain SURF_5) TaxID=2093360 RepID=A0A3A4P4Y8_ABYX5|nr:MAG: FHA domain-containing protein [Candidatus Abyssubacteria bacterium SURF_5]